MNEAPPDQRSAPRIDMHVHMVGNGVAGSGGWLRLKGWHRWLAGFMLRQLGVPATALEGDLETIYAEHLGKLVRESSMNAVVLLAHERVHDPDGTPREDLGSMFVPNDVVLGLAKRFPEFLPGVSIHPARPDALDELERCLEGGAVLMKCLPNCQNIDFSDRRYEAFWKRMAEARLPLLAHTGGRTHRAGDQRGPGRSALAPVSARMRRDSDRGALRHQERRFRSRPLRVLGGDAARIS
jgi:hypothetical protein